MHIVQANREHVSAIAPLFDQYRVFYKQESNLEVAKQFIEERLTKKDAVIFFASIENNAVGFVQLYPSFSSVSLQRLYILNDLYVDTAHRESGIGAALLNKAKEYCKINTGKGLALETALDNPAQHLYEKLGWKRDAATFHYFWTSNK